MKKWTVLCALSLSFALYSGVDAQAQEQEQNVTINTEITGNLASKTDTNTYTFKVEKAGKITLNATSYMTNLRLTIYDSNQKQVDSVSGFTKASATNAVKKNTSVYLEPGIYTVKAASSPATAGDYRFTIDYKNSYTNEIESNNNIEIAQPLALSTANTVGQLSWNDKRDYYKVDVKEAGYLSFKVTSNIKSLNFKLVNELDELIAKETTSKATETNEEIETFGEYVEKGIYYLKVEGTTGNEEGIYKIQANLEAANSDEQEGNGEVKSAQLLELNKEPVTGLISWVKDKGGDVDYYKVSVPKKSVVKINVWSYFSGLKAELLSEKGTKLESQTSSVSATNTSPTGPKFFEGTLEEGTHYIKFYSENKLGKYKVSAELNATTSIQLDAVDDKSKKVSGKIVENAEVAIYVNNQLIETVKADNKGLYSSTYKNLKANDEVKVVSKNELGEETTQTIKVLDKTAPAKPTVQPVTAKATKLTGKAEAGSTVYVYNKRKLVGKAIASKKGVYTIKIKKQKAGTTLTIRAQDKAKNNSAKKSIKVKK